jgi:RNA polymerase sigma-70 factor (ECF subfamily)
MQDSAEPRSSTGNRRCDAALFDAARRGSREAWGKLLEDCRPFLLAVANEELGDAVRSKAGASDVVQETCLEAHRDFDRFAGHTQDDLRRWLRQILKHNLANLRRSFLNTSKRSVLREVPLDGAPRQTGAEPQLAADSTSPSGRAIRREQEDLLERTLDELPADYRQVLLLRHRDQLDFHAIGRQMDRSPDAARMLWWRAFERLAERLEERNAN